MPRHIWMRLCVAPALAAGAAALVACASVEPQYTVSAPKHAKTGAYKVGAPYQVAGVWYVPKEQPDYDERGVASWYGDEFNLKPTANGEIFDKTFPSAAHTTLPLPSMVEVTNLDNGKKLVVRVNDRGPFVGGRIIDLSHEAARELGYDRQGLAHVRVRYLGPAPLNPADGSVRYATISSPSSAVEAMKPKPAPRTPHQVALAFGAQPERTAASPSDAAPY
jgi:rare lipoprotein A